MPVEMGNAVDYVKLPPEDVAKTLLESDYSHLYCYRVDEAFYQKYSTLFENPQEIANTTLYKILRIENQIVLRKVI